jgi:hypothetical protein
LSGSRRGGELSIADESAGGSVGESVSSSEAVSQFNSQTLFRCPIIQKVLGSGLQRQAKRSPTAVSRTPGVSLILSSESGLGHTNWLDPSLPLSPSSIFIDKHCSPNPAQLHYSKLKEELVRLGEEGRKRFPASNCHTSSF